MNETVVLGVFKEFDHNVIKGSTTVTTKVKRYLMVRIMSSE